MQEERSASQRRLDTLKMLDDFLLHLFPANRVLHRLS
jgi:hypothetical protein